MSELPEPIEGQTIAVTGANGFLGAHLIEALTAGGAKVRALVRNPRSFDAPSEAVEVLRVAYDEPRTLQAALRGADALVHAAGGGKVGDVEDFYRANRDTTRALIAAAWTAAPKLRRFVLISSAAARGPARRGRPSRESDPAEPVSHYGKSKLAAEEALLAVKDRLPVTILRPPAVYGPKDTRMLGLFSAVQRGLLPKLSAGQTSMVYVQDCVQAILRTLTVEHESGRAYFVCDGQTYSHERIGQAIEAALGQPALRIPIPAGLLRLVATASERWAHLSGGTTFLTRDKVVDLLQPSWLLDPTLIQQELGFNAEVHFEEGARRTAEGYRAEGWL